MDERVIIPYAPRAQQREIHNLLDKHRFGCVVCHRRFGKTVLSLNHAIKAALTCSAPRPRVAYIAPTYRQAKLIAWDYAKEFSRPIPGVQLNEAELRVDFPNGGRLQLLGAETADSLRGIYLDLAVLDEYALMGPRVWSEIIRPTLADRGGKSFRFMQFFVFFMMHERNSYISLTCMKVLVNEMTEQKTYTAGQKVGAGKDVCIDCGKELTLDKSEQDLRKCPSCACEEYQCFPMTHIRPDIKTPEDARNPPKRGKSNQ